MHDSDALEAFLIALNSHDHAIMPQLGLSLGVSTKYIESTTAGKRCWRGCKRHAYMAPHGPYSQASRIPITNGLWNKTQTFPLITQP